MTLPFFSIILRQLHITFVIVVKIKTCTKISFEVKVQTVRYITYWSSLFQLLFLLTSRVQFT
jgi:hypothetical protein